MSVALSRSLLSADDNPRIIPVSSAMANIYPYAYHNSIVIFYSISLRSAINPQRPTTDGTRHGNQDIKVKTAFVKKFYQEHPEVDSNSNLAERNFSFIQFNRAFYFYLNEQFLSQT